MKILDLRNVGSFEIPDSYRGILRISPNENVDDPSNLLTTVGSSVQLSDSDGEHNLLPVTFVSQQYSTIVVGRSSSLADLIHLKLDVENLFVVNRLNIKSTLLLTPNTLEPPLIFAASGSSLGYPLDAPLNPAYFNYNNKFKFDKNASYAANIEAKISADNDIYDEENAWQWSNVNNEYQFRHVKQNDQYYKVPILKKRDYILGTCPNGKYRKRVAETTSVIDLSAEYKNSSASRHTQLSWIDASQLSEQTIQYFTNGLVRSYAGRYFNLNSTGSLGGAEDDASANNLGKALFGNDASNETIRDKAPILGTGVQSGTIHYNAIPRHRYFFHLLRRYNDAERNAHLEEPANSSITKAYLDSEGGMNNLFLNYVLCDGKSIDSYPNINAGFLSAKWSAVHKAIAKSIDENTENELTFKTPPLFECDQLSLRYLRGLNWVRKEGDEYYDGSTPLDDEEKYDDSHKTEFENNELVYNKIPNASDAANHSKDIHKVGMYYYNTDSNLQKNYKHMHLLFGNKNGEAKSGDTLDSLKDIFIGKYEEGDTFPGTEWSNYVKGIAPTYKGSVILKTCKDITGLTSTQIKQLENSPIAATGGFTGSFYQYTQCIRFGKRKLGKCSNSRTRCQPTITVKEGYYSFAHSDANNTSWRLVSSLPKQNKYGLSGSISISWDSLSFAKFGSVKVFVDDSLGTPPSLNLIPLMKI